MVCGGRGRHSRPPREASALYFITGHTYGILDFGHETYVICVVQKRTSNELNEQPRLERRQRVVVEMKPRDLTLLLP